MCLSETEQKMEFLINPHAAHVLIVTTVMLLGLTLNESKFTLPKVGMVLCFATVVSEFACLKWNLGAFLADR